jgi:hypothetical protein
VAALPLAGRGRPEAAPLGGDRFVWEVAAALLPAALGAVAAWWISRSGRIGRAAGALAGGLAATTVILVLFLVPRFDVVKSARHLSGALAARMAPGETYGIHPRLDATFLFYTQRFAENLDSEEKLRTYVNRPGRVWLLIQRDDLSRLDPPLPPMREVARDADEKEGYLLLTKP